MAQFALLITLAGCGGVQPTPSPAPVAGGTRRQAFVEGYRAYVAKDFSTAITRLTYAAENYTQLGDYALFYLADSQRQAGDLNAATMSANRLIENYPQSILAGRARV